MSSANYPTHRPARVTQARVLGRISVAVKRVTDVRHPEAVQEWAATNEGRFPTREAVSRSVGAEFELLVQGLGRLTALDPDEVFPGLARDKARRGRESGDERRFPW